MSSLAKTRGLPSLENLWQEWRAFCEKPPRGFEKFFKENEKKGVPKEKKGKEEESKPPPEQQAEQKAKPFPTGAFSSKSPPPSSSKPDPQQWSFGMFGGTR